MRPITATLIFLASFPSYSCPFHGPYFFGDDETTLFSKTVIGTVKGENPGFATEISTQILFQSNNFESQLKQWKEDKREQ